MRHPTLAVIGRYVLPPEIFPILRKTTPGKNGEIQLTDALKTLAKQSPMYAHEIEGQRHDAGDKLGFLIATVEFALKNPSLGTAEFRDYLPTDRSDPSRPRGIGQSRHDHRLDLSRRASTLVVIDAADHLVEPTS